MPSIIQNKFTLIPISVKYVIIFWGACVYVRTTLRKVAVAIIENITAVIIAVSLRQFFRPEKVSSL